MITAQGKKIKKEPNNNKYKSDLTQLKRTLKRTVRKNKLNYKETILQEMNWSRKNNNKFWKLLDKLDYKQKDDIFMQGISSNRWEAHFKSVLQNPNIGQKGQLPQNTAEQGSLDFEISEEEIKIGAYILRHNKSSGMDCISNEMISCLLSTRPEIIKKTL